MSPPLFGGDPEKKLLDEIRSIVETAKKYQMSGKTDQAANEFRAALRTYNKYVEEVKKFRKEYSQTLTDIGRGLYALDEVERAIEALEKALQLDPKNVSAWLFKGSIHFANPGTANYAVICYTEAVKLDPKNATAWRNLGDAYRALGKNEEAISAYRNLIKIEPNNLTNYDRILKINPNDTGALLGKAEIFVKQGKVDEAVEIYKLLFEIEPSVRYYEAIAALKPDEAQALKVRLGGEQAPVQPTVVEMPPASETPGVEQSGQAETAEEAELIPVKKEDMQPLRTEELPTLPKQTIPIPETVQVVTPVEIKSVPAPEVPQKEQQVQPQTSSSVGVQLLEAKFTPEQPALEILKQFVSENLEDHEKILVILDKLIETGRYSDIIALMEIILPVHTTNEVFWYYNGVSLAKVGKLKEAIDSFSVCVKLEPESVDAYLAMGTVYIQLNDFEKATAALNEVLKRSPREAEAWYLKSVIEAKNGDYNKAKAFLKQATLLDEEYRERAKNEQAFLPMKDDPAFKALLG